MEDGQIREREEWRIGNNNSLGIRVMNKSMPGVIAFTTEALTAFGAHKGRRAGKRHTDSSKYFDAEEMRFREG